MTRFDPRQSHESVALRGAPPIRPGSTDNAKANRKAYAQMSEAEQVTGRTCEELAEEQARLRAEFYRRSAAA